MIHKSYINVLIANIFQYWRSFCDFTSSRYKNNPVIQAAMSQKTVFHELNMLKTKHVRPYIDS